MIRNVVHDPDRFAEVSVAIVDYDMPGENGMEICRRLRNHPVRTVMLTGKADEKLATSAFNQGLIDRFVLNMTAPRSMAGRSDRRTAARLFRHAERVERHHRSSGQ